MNMTLNKRWCLTAILALSAVVYTSSSYAATDRLVIESGDSAQSRQQASMEKEQWNDTRSLRQKVNKRAEKDEFFINGEYRNTIRMCLFQHQYLAEHKTPGPSLLKPTAQ